MIALHRGIAAPTIAALLGLAAAAPLPAAAGTVTFSTTSSQLCVGANGCGVSTQTLGAAVNVSFQPAAGITVNAAPTSHAYIGSLIVQCIGGGTGCATQSLAGLNLYVTIAQAVPLAGFAVFPAMAFTGTISGTASNATIKWAPSATGVTIGTATYTPLGSKQPLLPPSAGAGIYQLAVSVTDTSAGAPPPVYTGLDIDGNGSVDALTDGLMLLRYMFGLRGTSLTSGAVANGAPRGDATSIEPYIQSLAP